MRPAILSLLLALVGAPFAATAGPTIEQLRVTLITGEDAMRGSSDPVPSTDISTTITPDPVLRIEWVEMTISGPTVAGPRNFSRIEASEGREPTRDSGLTPGEAPSFPPPVITPPDGLIGSRW